MDTPKPMDPEELDRVFGHLRTQDPCVDSRYSEFEEGPVRRLLSGRDHWEAEAGRLEAARETLAMLRDDMERQRDEALAEVKRYRDRCPVTAEDVKAAGVTYTEGMGHAMCESTEGLVRIRQTGTYEAGPNGRRVKVNYGVVWFINDLSSATGCPAFDILDEMAAEVTS